MSAQRRKGGKIAAAVGIAVAKRGATSERVIREVSKLAEARAAEELPLGGDEMRKLVRAARERALRKDRQFIEGQRKPRRDALCILIDDALAELGRGATAEVILDAIEGSVQEIEREDQMIFWLDKAGREKKTTFKSFYNRVAVRRKLFKK
jgi:hypothetical protein